MWVAWWVGSGCHRGDELHLAFGGDVCTGDELNAALHDPGRRTAMFADAPPELRTADLTLVNGEGVVAAGGWPIHKGEPRPITYRARPELAGVLAEAGVDLVNLANNHAGDYGPDALHETLDRLRLAGIDPLGAGVDAAEARRPAYRRVGDVVVAFVGADLTNTTAFAATADRAGTLALPLGDAAEVLRPIVAEARAHADLVFLTVHWGPNFAEAPTEGVRRAAKRLVGLGVDAILGHSAHVPQGVELVEGRPVLYDAGNLLLGDGGAGDLAEGLLYDLTFTRAGVTSVRAIPIHLGPGRVRPGGAATLSAWTDHTRALGTEVDGDRVRCDPGPSRARAEEPPPPPPPPDPPFTAPSDALPDTVPPWATPLEAEFSNGMTLVAYHLLADALSVPKAGQVVDLWFRVEAPQAPDLRIELRAHGRGADRDRHMPADWALAGDELVPGRLLHDRALLRLKQDAGGLVAFSVALRGDAGFYGVTGPEVVDGAAVLGRVPYVAGAPWVLTLPDPAHP